MFKALKESIIITMIIVGLFITSFFAISAFYSFLKNDYMTFAASSFLLFFGIFIMIFFDNIL
jgi:hypothetical protein